MISILALSVLQGGIPLLDKTVTGFDPFLGDGGYFPLGMDFDGDGHEDFIMSDSSSGGIKVRFADGSSLILDQSGGNPGDEVWISNEVVNCPDLEGDGLPNALGVSVGSGVQQRCIININYLAATPVAEITLLGSPGNSGDNGWGFGGNNGVGNWGHSKHMYPDQHIYGDVGGDGDPDVLITGFDGSGHFVAAVSLTIGELYRFSASANPTIVPDVNGDNVPDYIVSSDLLDGVSGTIIKSGGLRDVACILDDITGDGVEEVLWRNSSISKWEAFDLVLEHVVWSIPYLIGFEGPQWSHLGGKPNLIFLSSNTGNGRIKQNSPFVDMETGETLVTVSGEGTAQYRHPCRWYRRIPPDAHPTSNYEPLMDGFLSLLTWPCMTSPDSGLSSGAGGVFGLELNFTKSFSGGVYRVLLSSAAGSTIIHGDLEVPLGFTDMFVDSYFGIYPTHLTQGMAGVLDAEGRAFGALGALAGQIPGSAVGLTIHCAAIVRDYGSAYSVSSVAVPISLLP